MNIETSRKQRAQFKNWRWTQIEVAKAMGVSRATINTWQHEGLPHERQGREVLFRPWIVFSWTLGRGIAKGKGLDIRDALSLAILGRCRGTPPPARPAGGKAMRQEALWIAEGIGRDKDEALVVLGELLGKGLIQR